MTRTRNAGGRFSAKHGSDWYREIEEANIRRVEAEWQAKQAITAYYAQLDEECAADELAEQYETRQAA